LAAHDEIADWYDGLLRRGPLGLFHEWMVPVLLDLAGDLEGVQVCDLACGQGIVARRLADRGATVFGADVSREMLGIARLRERKERRGIEYALGDAQSLAAVADESFDGVVCSMALMDIPDLDATLRTVSRILRPGGWFVFSIVHPIAQTPDSPKWVERRARSLGWK
jgi:ubiquinone/menaquinone biosynthesis C-methylase UbiE